MHCGSVRSVGSVACVKKFKMFHFTGSDGSVGQSDHVVQIYQNTLSKENAFVIKLGKTHGYIKKKTFVDERK